MQFNIEKALGMLNSSVIKPGEQLSLNKVLGERSAANGWKEGYAIVNGAYTKHYGTGVSAVATALYNAALRAELKINDIAHAAIKSYYVPGGLDATISSAGPDLVIENSYDSDITIEAKVTDDKYIDIYIYGPELGYTVDFFSEGNIGEAPPQKYVYNKTVTPDSTKIAKGDAYEWCKSRGEETYKIYKVIKKPGDLLGETTLYETYTYRPLQGYTYVNGPDPQA
jgi:vancomycin resistance protein YoaR